MTDANAKCPRLNNDELSIDFKRREIKIRGREITLSRLEFELLAHLIMADGAVCDKTDLLKHVWRKVHIEVGAIAKCVSLLRSKLKVQSPHKFIVTVNRVGYKFNRERNVICHS